MNRQITRWFLLVVLGSGLNGVTRAGEECGVSHQNGCGHVHAGGSYGACWNNGGNGVTLCDGQAQNVCNGLAAYEVNQDWFKECLADATHKVTDGDIQRDCWSAHNNCLTPDTQCYRSVVCTWSTAGQTPKCVVGSGQAWVSLPKPSTAACQ